MFARCPTRWRIVTASGGAKRRSGRGEVRRSSGAERNLVRTGHSAMAATRRAPRARALRAHAVFPLAQPTSARRILMEGQSVEYGGPWARRACEGADRNEEAGGRQRLVRHRRCPSLFLADDEPPPIPSRTLPWLLLQYARSGAISRNARVLLLAAVALRVSPGCAGLFSIARSACSLGVGANEHGARALVRRVAQRLVERNSARARGSSAVRVCRARGLRAGRTFRRRHRRDALVLGLDVTPRLFRSPA